MVLHLVQHMGPKTYSSMPKGCMLNDLGTEQKPLFWSAASDLPVTSDWSAASDHDLNEDSTRAGRQAFGKHCICTGTA